MKQPKLLALAAIVFSLALPTTSWAVSCDAIFTNGLQTNTGAGVIDLFGSGITMTGGSTTLDAGSVTGTSASTACSGACAASGAAAATSNPAVLVGDGSDGAVSVAKNKASTVGASGDNQFTSITLAQGADLVFSSLETTYYTGAWNLGVNSSLTLAPGDYWVNGDIFSDLGADILTSPAGTVRIFVNGTITLGKNSTINTDGAGELLFYASGDIDIIQGTSANSYFYSGGDVTIEKNSEITGAISGQNISADLGVTINYVQPSASGGDFGTFCESAAAVDHYAITYTGTPLTCEPLTVTVEARDASNNPVTPPASTVINLSTNVSVDAWTPASSFTFTGAESSTNFGLSQTTAGTVDIDVSDGTASAPDDGGAEDQRPTFVDTALRFVEDNGAGGFDVGIDNQVAGVESPASGSNTIYLEAVESSLLSNPSAPVQCVGAFAPNTSVSVDLGGECKNPGTCAGVSVAVANNGTSGTISTNNDNSVNTTVAGYTTRTLLFDANSRAPLVVSYADVGQMQLHARYEALDNEGSGLGFYITGLSNDFVVSPYSLVITAIETDSAASSSNPGTTNSGSGFVAAGDTFYVQVEAQDDSGAITPNYGNESSPEGIRLDIASLVYPAGGANGALSNDNSFSVTGTQGRFENSTLSWSEVGTLTLEAHVDDGDYLGAGDVSSVDTSGSVGRFFPDHFNVASSVIDACVAGNFSYMDQDSITATITLQARTLGGGAIVTNYDNDTLTYNASTVTFYGENDGDGSDLIGRFSLAPLDSTPQWSGGQIVIDSSVNPFAFSREANPDGPYEHIQLGLVVDDTLDSRTFDSALNFNPAASANYNAGTDADGCIADGNCTGMKIGDPVDLRFGRLLTRDSHGPESAPLPVPFQVEYWNGNLFVVNTDDSSSTPANDGCTSVLRTRFFLDGADTSADFTVPVGVATTTGGFTIATDLTDVFMSSGTAGLIFSAPLTTGSFPLQVINVDSWLRFDWDNDGNHTDVNVPLSTISFGSYRGHDRVIYWRESFNN